MAYRLHPGTIVDGFFERLSQEKYKPIAVWNHDISAWLKQRSIPIPKEIERGRWHMVEMGTIETWMTIPLPPNQLDWEKEVTTYFGEMLIHGKTNGATHLMFDTH